MEDHRVEVLAEYAHQAWSGWMEYLFSKCEPKFREGSLEIPSWAVERWKRQMTTPYTDLPDGEKESDREEARRMLRFLDEAEATLPGTGPTQGALSGE